MNHSQKHSAAALCCFFAFDLKPVSGRRDGFGKVRRMARRDSGQFAASTWMCCQRTPEPSRVVVRLHRTTDPPRAHLWATFLCEQKGGSAGGSPAKRLYRLATANKRGEGKPGHIPGSSPGQSGDYRPAEKRRAINQIKMAPRLTSRSAVERRGDDEVKELTSLASANHREDEIIATMKSATRPDPGTRTRLSAREGRREEYDQPPRSSASRCSR